MASVESKIRLSKDELQALQRKLPRPAVTDQTTDLQAGYLLGIQHVIEVLRDGWVVGEPD